MTPRDLQVNQVRRRKRRIPSTPPEPEVSIRVYCPSCPDVQRGYGQFRTLYGNQVRQHFREVVAPDPRRSDSFAGESLNRVRCPGGTVDLIKDRAP